MGYNHGFRYDMIAVVIILVSTLNIIARLLSVISNRQLEIDQNLKITNILDFQTSSDASSRLRRLDSRLLPIPTRRRALVHYLIVHYYHFRDIRTIENWKVSKFVIRTFLLRAPNPSLILWWLQFYILLNADVNLLLAKSNQLYYITYLYNSS